MIPYERGLGVPTADGLAEGAPAVSDQERDHILALAAQVSDRDVWAVLGKVGQAGVFPDLTLGEVARVLVENPGGVVERA